MDNSLIQGTPEWKEMRRSKIMASDSPIIMGLSPWKTPFQLYWDKITGHETEKTYYMERGILLETEALEIFGKEKGCFLTPTVRFHEKDEWLGASCDGWNEEGILLEIKCPGKKDHSTAICGEVPEKYYPQLQHLMFVFNVPQMYYMSYNPDHQYIYEIITVQKNPDYIKKWYPKVEEFYGYLKNKTPPPAKE